MNMRIGNPVSNVAVPMEYKLYNRCRTELKSAETATDKKQILIKEGAVFDRCNNVWKIK